jgi:universal stress protein A
MSLSLKKILVPTDFSDHASDSFLYAVELARKFDASLTFLHVLQDAVALFPEPGVAFPAAGTYLEGLQELAEDGLKRLQETIGDEIPITTEIRNGTPFVEIIRFAKENAIDLIVIATHGRSGLAHVLMGSVAEKVVRKAPCPVLTVRPAGHEFVLP